MPNALPTDSASAAPAAPPESKSREPSGATASGGSGLILGIAMGLGNALSYVFVLIVTRALGPEAFGAYSALTTLGIVLAIPAGAFQVMIAGRWNRAGARTSGVRAAWWVGLGLTIATVLASSVLRTGLHLPSIWPAIATAALLIPMTLTGSFQGVLLGSGRLRALSGLYLVTAGTRLIAAVWCAGLHASLTQVLWAMVAAGVITMVWGWWISRDLLASSPSHAPSLIRDMIRSNTTLAAFTALTNVDVVLVRHFLSETTSGGYGLASTFGRAMCWGTQFVALMLVPRMGRAGTSAMWRAAALILGLGVVALGVASISPGTLVILVGGEKFTGFGSLVVACIALGTIWALAQLWLFSEMAGDDGFLGVLAWLMVVLELVLGWFVFHHSAFAIVTLAAVCSLVVVLAGMWRTRTHPMRHLEETTDLLVADHPA